MKTAEEFEDWFDTVRFASADPKQELIDALKKRDAALFSKGAEWMRDKIKDIPDFIYCPADFMDEIYKISLTEDEVK